MPNASSPYLVNTARGFLAAVDWGFQLYGLRFKSWLLIVVLMLLPICPRLFLGWLICPCSKICA